MTLGIKVAAPLHGLRTAVCGDEGSPGSSISQQSGGSCSFSLTYSLLKNWHTTEQWVGNCLYIKHCNAVEGKGGGGDPK